MLEVVDFVADERVLTAQRCLPCWHLVFQEVSSGRRRGRLHEPDGWITLLRLGFV